MFLLFINKIIVSKNTTKHGKITKNQDEREENSARNGSKKDIVRIGCLSQSRLSPSWNYKHSLCRVFSLGCVRTKFTKFLIHSDRVVRKCYLPKMLQAIKARYSRVNSMQTVKCCCLPASRPRSASSKQTNHMPCLLGAKYIKNHLLDCLDVRIS